MKEPWWIRVSSMVFQVSAGLLMILIGFALAQPNRDRHRRAECTCEVAQRCQ